MSKKRGIKKREASASRNHNNKPHNRDNRLNRSIDRLKGWGE